MSRRDGRVHWVHRLPPFEDMEDREDPIQYTGPVLVGDRLLVGSSDGFLYAISPYTGELLGHIEVGDSLFVSPVVAHGPVYFLTNAGPLPAARYENGHMSTKGAGVRLPHVDMDPSFNPPTRPPP